MIERIVIDGRSRKDRVIALFAEKDHDSVVTYEELGTLLGLHSVTQRHLIQSAVYSAKETLSNEKKRSIEPVRGMGYRIRLPEEHLPAAAALQLRAARSLTLARREVDSIDLSKLSPEQRKAALTAATVLAWQQQQLRIMDLRQERLERVVESVSTKVEQSTQATARRLAELEQRIAEQEARLAEQES